MRMSGDGLFLVIVALVLLALALFIGYAGILEFKGKQ